MSHSFYFYDLETSGISPKNSRIMQFAGRRADLDIKNVIQEDNFLIKITPDILPDPEAVLITGITPQQTLSDGISEAEFLKYFYKNIALNGTIFVGFNNIRFDDEFTRYTNYRNFYDPYRWHWQDNRSRWDLLDVVRMTRALRPEGINWPFSTEGQATNRLELLSSVNKLVHSKAHDALSDVEATIEIARLIKQKQPKLFDYLLEMRDKKRVESMVTKPEPFIYTSGRYDSESEKTTVAITLTDHPTQKGSVIVYDLKTSPEKYVKMSPSELLDRLKIFTKNQNEDRLPVKILQFNHCPAIAPMSVLDVESQKRLAIDLEEIDKHLQAILANSDFVDNIREAITTLDKQKQSSFIVDVKDVDTQLYDGFFGDEDQEKMQQIRSANQNQLADLNPLFNDKRLEQLLLLYKARQFPKSLNESEQKLWETYRQQKLFSKEGNLINKYFLRINELAKKPKITKRQAYILEELRLYGESLMPY